ncbi:uncharacterized protein LOC110901290 [Helianthus annuus]|uniref:uncharacterized protein LOC110901290 n=1 Tax=Helianthus annuus TaxID=4232 RepID=UPI000B90A42E|nr:uncharacterized protein LOC110901290 [Helianthus annuus]
MGNGAHIRFWLDKWCGNASFSVAFPALFRLAADKQDPVARCWDSQRLDVCCGWKRPVSSNAELEELLLLRQSIGSLFLSNSADRWRWEGNKDGVFNVADFKNLLVQQNGPDRNSVMKWIVWVPLKVKVFVWRLEMDRIPTRLALQRRNMHLSDVSCGLCGAVDESSIHIFTACELSCGFWTAIGSWCKLGPIFAFDIKDLLLLPAEKTSKESKKIIQGIVMVSMCVIWVARNEKIFRSKDVKIGELVAKVKSLSFLWLKSRSRYKQLVWKDWTIFPLYMMQSCCASVLVLRTGSVFY